MKTNPGMVEHEAISCLETGKAFNICGEVSTAQPSLITWGRAMLQSPRPDAYLAPRGWQRVLRLCDYALSLRD